jgi:hypothetical protein
MDDAKTSIEYLQISNPVGEISVSNMEPINSLRQNFGNDNDNFYVWYKYSE